MEPTLPPWLLLPPGGSAVQSNESVVRLALVLDDGEFAKATIRASDLLRPLDLTHRHSNEIEHCAVSPRMAMPGGSGMLLQLNAVVTTHGELLLFASTTAHPSWELAIDAASVLALQRRLQPEVVSWAPLHDSSVFVLAVSGEGCVSILCIQPSLIQCATVVLLTLRIAFQWPLPDGVAATSLAWLEERRSESSSLSGVPAGFVLPRLAVGLADGRVEILEWEQQQQQHTGAAVDDRKGKRSTSKGPTNTSRAGGSSKRAGKSASINSDVAASTTLNAAAAAAGPSWFGSIAGCSTHTLVPPCGISVRQMQWKKPSDAAADDSDGARTHYSGVNDGATREGRRDSSSSSVGNAAAAASEGITGGALAVLTSNTSVMVWFPGCPTDAASLGGDSHTASIQTQFAAKDAATSGGHAAVAVSHPVHAVASSTPPSYRMNASVYETPIDCSDFFGAVSSSSAAAASATSALSNEPMWLRGSLLLLRNTLDGLHLDAMGWTSPTSTSDADAVAEPSTLMCATRRPGVVVGPVQVEVQGWGLHALRSFATAALQRKLKLAPPSPSAGPLQLQLPLSRVLMASIPVTREFDDRASRYLRYRLQSDHSSIRCLPLGLLAAVPLPHNFHASGQQYASQVEVAGQRFAYFLTVAVPTDQNEGEELARRIESAAETSVASCPSPSTITTSASAASTTSMLRPTDRSTVQVAVGSAFDASSDERFKLKLEGSGDERCALLWQGLHDDEASLRVIFSELAVAMHALNERTRARSDPAHSRRESIAAPTATSTPAAAPAAAASQQPASSHVNLSSSVNFNLGSSAAVRWLESLDAQRLLGDEDDDAYCAAALFTGSSVLLHTSAPPVQSITSTSTLNSSPLSGYVGAAVSAFVALGQLTRYRAESKQLLVQQQTASAHSSEAAPTSTSTSKSVAGAHDEPADRSSASSTTAIGASKKRKRNGTTAATAEVNNVTGSVNIDAASHTANSGTGSSSGAAAVSEGTMRSNFNLVGAAFSEFIWAAAARQRIRRLTALHTMLETTLSMEKQLQLGAWDAQSCSQLQPGTAPAAPSASSLSSSYHSDVGVGGSIRSATPALQVTQQVEVGGSIQSEYCDRGWRAWVRLAAALAPRVSLWLGCELAACVLAIEREIDASTSASMHSAHGASSPTTVVAVDITHIIAPCAAELLLGEAIREHFNNNSTAPHDWCNNFNFRRGRYTRAPPLPLALVLRQCMPVPSVNRLQLAAQKHALDGASPGRDSSTTSASASPASSSAAAAAAAAAAATATAVAVERVTTSSSEQQSIAAAAAGPTGTSTPTRSSKPKKTAASTSVWSPTDKTDAAPAPTSTSVWPPGAASETDNTPIEVATDAHDDACVTCDSKNKKQLLLCDACPIVQHVKCAGLISVPRGDWFCADCSAEQCPVCGTGPVPADDSILCGDGAGAGCDATFHLSCVGLQTAPEGDWFCTPCLKVKLGLLQGAAGGPEGLQLVIDTSGEGKNGGSEGLHGRVTLSARLWRQWLHSAMWGTSSTANGSSCSTAAAVAASARGGQDQLQPQQQLLRMLPRHLQRQLQVYLSDSETAAAIVAEHCPECNATVPSVFSFDQPSPEASLSQRVGQAAGKRSVGQTASAATALSVVHSESEIGVLNYYCGGTAAATACNNGHLSSRHPVSLQLMY